MWCFVSCTHTVTYWGVSCFAVSVSFDNFRNVHPVLKEDSSSSSDSDDWGHEDLGEGLILCKW